MQLLNVEELARILRVSRRRAYALASSGALPSVRIGRQVRVSEEGLQVWVARGGCPLRCDEARDD
jgi:excisionase family DNA binding protein